MLRKVFRISNLKFCEPVIGVGQNKMIASTSNNYFTLGICFIYVLCLIINRQKTQMASIRGLSNVIFVNYNKSLLCHSQKIGDDCRRLSVS
jgi:hypothetical protein